MMGNSMTRFNRVSANDNHIINDNLKEDSFFLEDKDDVGKVVELLNEQQATIDGLKEKLCEFGVSDVKINGKRINTGLEEWLE